MSDDFSSASQPGLPEYLEQGSGQPLPAGDQKPSASRVKPVLIGAAVLGGAALASAGAWAALALAGGGPQPAEALPDGTLGYVSVDLDPSAEQKIEAFRTLRKFPAFEDAVQLEDDDDLRRQLFDLIQDDADCANIDYEDDIAPWLGERAAVAAVARGEDGPQPVAVVAVTDEAKAVDGLRKIRNCGLSGDADDTGSGDASMGWAIADGWAVIAGSTAAAEEVQAAAADASLADDATHRRWLEEVGDPGIVTMYAAPEAGAAILDLSDDLRQMSAGGADTTAMPEDGTKALEDFGGMAGTLRFDQGGVEFEVAGDAGPRATALAGGSDAGAAVADLPEDTLAAFGLALGDDWFVPFIEQTGLPEAAGQSAEEFLASLSQQTGLELPADIETLLGDAAVVAVGEGIDADTLANSEDLSDVPVGVTVHGDVDGIDEVLEKLRGQLPAGASDVLASDSTDDVVAIGPNASYREDLLGDGGLGDTDTFDEVVQEADQAAALLFIDFDGGDDWLSGLAGDDARVAENLEPLSGLGFSVWLEDGTSHAVLRLTTD